MWWSTVLPFADSPATERKGLRIGAPGPRICVSSEANSTARMRLRLGPRPGDKHLLSPWNTHSPDPDTRGRETQAAGGRPTGRRTAAQVWPAALGELSAHGRPTVWAVLEMDPPAEPSYTCEQD